MKIKLLIIALITSMCLFAQTPQDSIKLDEIVVNGIRSGKTTPVTEKTITRSEIQKTYQGYEVSSTLSNKTPNVTTSSDNGTQFGYTYFRIRGIDQTRINMTLNGVPLNEPEDQGVFFSNYPNFTDNIQSMEVQRGVGTSSNGVSSFAGSINFNSPSGFNKEVSVKYTVGDFNTVRLSTTYSSGLNSKKMALYVNGSTYNTDGYRYGSGGNGNSLFISGGYFGEKNKLKFTGFTGNSKNGMSWMAVSESDINKDPRTNYNKDDGWDNFTQTFTQLEYTNKVSTNSLLSSSIFYNRLNGGYDYLTPQFGGGNRNLFLSSNFYGIVTNLNYKGEKLKVDFGISGNIYNREHSYTFLETNKGYKN
jgi:iron complex outermembrane receptor protein